MSAARRCPLCKGEGIEKRKDRVLNKYDIAYYQCPVCGLLYTEEPYWLDEAYGNAINDSDTGLISRNIDLYYRLPKLLGMISNNAAKCLDYGGGYGMLVRMMRNRNYNFYLYDKYAQNIFARGFEWDNSDRKHFDVLTAIDVLEHFANVGEEIAYMESIADNIIFTQECYDEHGAVPDSDWWYYGQSHGQHIAFYSERTMRYIADLYGKHYYRLLGLHCFLKEPLLLAKRICLYIWYQYYRILRKCIIKPGYEGAVKDSLLIKENGGR